MRLIVLMLIVIAGLFLRLDQAWQGAEHNLPDSAAYERIARGVSQDGQFEQRGPGTPAHPQPASNYTPGLPLFTAAVFELSGDDSARVARLVLALIATAAIPLSWRLGSRLGGDAAGLGAAAITAFYPTLINDSGMLLTEPLAGTLITAALLAVLRAREKPGLQPWVLPGVLLGLTSLVRPEALLISASLAVALLLTGIRAVAPSRAGGTLVGAPAAPRAERRLARIGLSAGARSRPAGARAARTRARVTLGPVLVMSASLLLVISPLVGRDLLQSGRLVPLSTGGGQTLFTGSYTASEGDPTDVMPRVLKSDPSLAAVMGRQNHRSGEGPESITPERVLTLLAARRHPGEPTDAALAKMGWNSYLAQLRADPAGLAGYLAGKAGRIWWRGRVELIDSLPGRILHRGLVFAFLAGLITLAIRRRPEFWIVGAPMLSATVIGAVLVASPRRILMLWPVVAAVAGVGLAGVARLAFEAVDRRPRGRSHSLTAPDVRRPQPNPIPLRR